MLTRGVGRLGIVVLLLSSLVATSASAAIDWDATGRVVPCTPGKDTGCLPTPIECALGLYNGHWDGGSQGRVADCVGGAGHIVHYEGGYLGTDQVHGACGGIIDGDQVVIGGWGDPNLCPPTSAAPGFGVQGRAFAPAISSTGGVVASISPLVAEVGVDVLNDGGNAVDAAVAAGFAVGAVRPDACGLGGVGELVYRAADGTSAALEFEPTAPAAATPNYYEGHGLWEQDTGHRVVGVPGVVAGLSAALERYGTISLSDAIAPAVRLARDGVPVSPGLAGDYGLVALPSLPIPPLANTERLRLFPASAATYLKAGTLEYPADNPLSRSILKQRDLARSLALIAKHGPEAFYADRTYPEGPSIGHRILQEMENARTHSIYPGDAPVKWTAADLAGYRAVWRTPVTGTYRGYELIGEPPPSVGGVETVEILNLLEGFPFGTSIPHSSADYFHLLAEAQKIAWADASAHLSDPDFHENPTSVLTSKAYAEQRRSEIDLGTAKEYGPGSIGGVQSASQAAGGGLSTSHHTTHLSVIDREGDAVSLTCTLGAGFGSAVVAPGTGFVLNDLLDFGRPGTIDEARGGKRPLSTLTPTIVVRDGRVVLVTGAAGGFFIPAAAVLSISNAIDYGMDPARAVDAARGFSFCLNECPSIEVNAPPAGLILEDGRVLPDVSDELARRGHPVTAWGEYGFFPWAQIAGTDPITGLHVGASDPRGDRGARGQP